MRVNMVKLPTRAAVCLLLAIAIGVTSVFSDERVSAVAGDWLRGNIDYFTRNYEYGSEHGYTRDIPPGEEITVRVRGGGTEPVIARVYEGSSYKIAEVSNRGETRGTYVAEKSQDIYTRLNTRRGNDSVYGIRPILGTSKFVMMVTLTEPYVGTWVSVVDSLSGYISQSHSEVEEMEVYNISIDTLPLWLSNKSPGSTHYRLRLGNPVVFSKNMRYGVYPLSNGRYMRVDLMKKDAGVEFSAAQTFGLVAAVTNDGQYVFFDEGRNVLSIDDRCGLQVTKYSYLVGSYENKPACLHRKLDAASDLKIDSPGTFNFRLADNDESIAFDMWTNTGEAVHVTAALSSVDGVAKSRLKYLALGDSYSSGEGDIGKNEHGGNYYLPMTDIAKENGKGGDTCHISSRSYPFILRAAWGVGSDDMKSVACSGAKLTSDYYSPIAGYMGQEGRLQHRAHEIKQVHQNALERFFPGRVPQLEFVKKYQPEIVTVTGGGNDIGFGDILLYCATSPETCAQVKGGYGTVHEDFMADIDDQYGYTVAFLNKLKEEAPFTKVYYVGYPKFIADLRICGANAALLDWREIQMINDSIVRLNSVLARAARDAGATYIGIEDALRGGRICEGSWYMTGVVNAVVANRRLGSDMNMFHPNASGHEKIARAIWSEIDYVGKGGVRTVPDVEPAVRHNRIQKQYMVQKGVISYADDVSITIDSGVYRPNANITFNIYSTPTKLGEASSDENGNVTWRGQLPKGVKPGIHLLTATGVGVTGESVQVQQFVTVADSTSGELGLCAVIPYWYDETSGEDVCKDKVHRKADSTSATVGISYVDGKYISSSGVANNSLGIGSAPATALAGVDKGDSRSDDEEAPLVGIGRSNSRDDMDFSKQEREGWSGYVGIGIALAALAVVVLLVRLRRK